MCVFVGGGRRGKVNERATTGFTTDITVDPLSSHAGRVNHNKPDLTDLAVGESSASRVIKD